MPKSYTHVTQEERCRSETLRAAGWAGWGADRIAGQPGRKRATIYREVGRNGRPAEGERAASYSLGSAQERAERRRRAAACRPRQLTSALRTRSEDCLRQDWSPEQVAARLQREGALEISPERIYQLVRADRRQGGRLYRHPRQGGRKRVRRVGRTAGRGLIPGRADIAERPAEARAQARVGDREADTVIGGQRRGALVTLVDRFSQYLLVQPVSRRTAQLVGAAMTAMLAGSGAVTHTLTADNGKEFAARSSRGTGRHREVAQRLGAGFHFARPCHSWERGLNEHANGLPRQYFPQGTDLRRVDPARVREARDRLNRRPRKVPGGRTPEEVFLAERERVPRG